MRAAAGRLLVFLTLLLASLLLCAHGFATIPRAAIAIGEVPGSDGEWQEGVTIVPSGASQVRYWLTDYAHWTDRFPDIDHSEVLGRTPEGQTVVRFHSAIIGRQLTIRIRQTPQGIEYDGEGKNVTTQGKIYIQSLGPSQTRVVMQTTASLHGLSGALASEGMKRSRAQRKLRSDLTALLELSRSNSMRQK